MSNQDANTGDRGRRQGRLITLLVCLLALVGGACYLAAQAPYLRATYRGVDIDPQGARAMLTQSSEHDNLIYTWTAVTTLDLQTGATSQPHDLRFAALVHVEENGNTHWLAELGDVGVWNAMQSRDLQYIIYDSHTGRRLKSFPYQFDGSYRTMIQDRFLVTRRGRVIEVIDLAAKDPTPVSFPTGSTFRGEIESLGDTRNFVCRGTGGTSVELFQIDDDGKVKTLSIWPVTQSASGGFDRPGYSRGQLATISSDGKQLQLHSIADGSLVKTRLLPGDFDPLKMTWRMSGRLLVYLDQNRLKIFDWQAGQSLPSIEDSDRYWRHQGTLIVVRSKLGYERRVIDLQTGETVGRFRSRRGLNYFDRRRAIVSSADRGWTITEFDLSTGKISRQWRPFAFVAPAFLAWLTAFLGWCVAWLSASSKRGIPPWIDVLIIGGVSFGVLVFRAVMVGDPLESGRAEYHYLQGITMAGGTVLLLWLIFGRTRVTLRVLPMIAFCGFIAAVLVAIFRQRPSIPWYALASTFAPIVALSLSLIALRILKCRISLEEEPSFRKVQTRYPLRDLFLITLLVSAGFAVLRLITKEAGVLLDLSLLNWPLLISQIVGLAAIVGALARHRFLCLVTAMSAMVLLVVLAGEAFMSYQYEWLEGVYGSVIRSTPERILMTYPLAVFVMLLPFRMRGWRLRLRGFRLLPDRRDATEAPLAAVGP